MVDLCCYHAFRQDANMYKAGSESESWELLGQDASCSSAYAFRQRLAGSGREPVRRDASRVGPPRSRNGYAPVYPAAQTPRAGAFSPLRGAELKEPWLRRSSSDQHLDRLAAGHQEPQQQQQSRIVESPLADARQKRPDWGRPAERQQPMPPPTAGALMSFGGDEEPAHGRQSPPPTEIESGAPAAASFHKSANLRELSMLQSFAQAVICTDLEGIITFWNRAAELMYGWKAEEVIGVSVLNVLIPSRLIKEASDIIRRVAEGDSWTGRYSCLRRDGVVLNTVTTNSPIVDDNGNVVGVIGASIDANFITTDKSSLNRVHGDRVRKPSSVGDQSADSRWYNRAEDPASTAPSDATQGSEGSSRGSGKSLLQRLGCTSVQLLRKFSFGVSKAEEDTQRSPPQRDSKSNGIGTGSASPSKNNVIGTGSASPNRARVSSFSVDECSLDIRECSNSDSERGPLLQHLKSSPGANSVFSHPLPLDLNALSRTSSGSAPCSIGGSTMGASGAGSPVNNTPLSTAQDGSVNFHQAEEDYQLQLALALRVAAEAAAVDDPALVANVRGPIGGTRLMPGVSKTEATAYRYWVSNCLSYDDQIEDGFFEIWGMSPYVWSMCTDSNELGRMPVLESLRGVRPADAEFEVVLVDRTLDPDLRELEDRAVGLAYDSTEVLDLSSKLGKMVANVMGGSATSDEALMEPWKLCISEVMQTVGGIVLPIGKLRTGLCRHRALLFKVLADSVGLPCRLARGSSFCGKEDHAMVVVRSGEKEWMIDLVANPGHIMAPAARLSAPPAVIGSPLQFERPSPFAGSSITVMDWARSDTTSSNTNLKAAGSSEASATQALPPAVSNISFRTTVIDPNGGVSEYSAADADNAGQWQIPLARDSPAGGPCAGVESGGSLEAAGSSKVNHLRREATQEKLVVEQVLVPQKVVNTHENREGQLQDNSSDPRLHANDHFKKLLASLPSGMWATEDVCNQLEATDVSNTLKGTVVKKMLVAADEVDIPWEDISVGERIGQGSYGKVYRADWQGSDVAVKVFLHQDLKYEALEEFRSEVAMMRRLRHPNVVLFMGAVTKPPNLSIVTEFCPRGSLFRLLHRPNRELDERRRVRMALDVAKGMNYLHRCSPPVVHRDLKSPNLLVDKNWTVKVCDFGLSRQKHSTFLSSKSSAGTPEWMAPEVLRSEPSDEKADVYSFGVILWELATLQVPWGSLNPIQVVGAVGFQHRRLPIPDTVDPAVASIIQACWRTDPKTRPSFADIMQDLKPLQRPILPLNSPSLKHSSQDAMD